MRSRKRKQQTYSPLYAGTNEQWLQRASWAEDAELTGMLPFEGHSDNSSAFRSLTAGSEVADVLVYGMMVVDRTTPTGEKISSDIIVALSDDGEGGLQVTPVALMVMGPDGEDLFDELNGAIGEKFDKVLSEVAARKAERDS